MKAQGTVKGILVEGGDGQEYLLGFRPGSPGPTPTLSRRRADGRFEPEVRSRSLDEFLLAPPPKSTRCSQRE